MKKRDLTTFNKLVLSADGHRCMDVHCPCDGTGLIRDGSGNIIGGSAILDAHHVKKRSLGGLETAENGITLCRMTAHKRAEEGYTFTVGELKQRLSATEYMIRVLEYWQPTALFRWGKALEWLKLNRDRKQLETSRSKQSSDT